MDPARSPDLEATVRTTNLISAAILLAIPMYVVVALTMAADRGPVSTESGLPGILPWVLTSVAVALLLIAQVVRRSLVRAAAGKPTPADRLAGYRTATVVAFALREGAALVGLVLTLLTGDIRWCLGLSALAVLAMLLGWPRSAEAARLAADPGPPSIG